MKQSYCGLCETCLIDKPDFLEAIAKVKEELDQFPITWWAHCFPGDEGFSFPELRKGLDWFLSEPECRGCKEGGGLIPGCVHRGNKDVAADLSLRLGTASRAPTGKLLI